MKNLIIRAIGRLPEPWHHEAIHSYLKRMSTVDIIELPEGHRGAEKPDLNKTREAEADSLLKNLPKEATIVALDETGTILDSVQFSHQLASWTAGGRPVVFVIGGSWGLSDTVRKRAHIILSLGRLTLPHAIARIILIEQLYRAHMLQSGKTYHK